VNPASGEAWVLYLLLNKHHASGVGVGIWRGFDQPVERLRVGDSWLLFPAPEPEFMNAPIVHGAYLYTFGCVRDFVEHLCSLARVPIDAVANRSAWRVFDGKNWVHDLSRRRTLFVGAPIMSVSWNEALGRFLLVYSKPFDHEAYARTAEQLEGPWSEEAVLFKIPGEPAYDLNQHAELAEEGGRVVWLTYSRRTKRGLFGAEHVAWRVQLLP
jgi:hypothetical protein